MKMVRLKISLKGNMIMKRHRNIFSLLTFILIVFTISITAYADMGPKDSLTIYVENPPNEEYYLDLLTTKSGEYNNFQKGEREDLDHKMIKLLYSYKNEGWLPALTQGTDVPMWGKHTGTPDAGRMVHEFGYVGLPETYKIIIVTKSGKVTVSDTYTRKALQSSINYDYNTNKGHSPSLLFAYLLQFSSTCIPTLIIELIILLLFGFKIKDNYKVFLLTNLATQIFLTVSLGSTLIIAGSLSACLAQFPVEIIILMVETMIYIQLLKGHTGKRRCAYGIVANLISWAVGFFFLSQQYILLVSVM